MVGLGQGGRKGQSLLQCCHQSLGDVKGREERPEKERRREQCHNVSRRAPILLYWVCLKIV